MFAGHRPARVRPPAAARAAGAAPWPALALVTAGLFLAVLSTTVVSVALPTIGRDLHAGAAGQEWTVDAYVLVYASLLLAGGVAGDRRGRKGVFLLGVGLFGLGSLASGLAPATGPGPRSTGPGPPHRRPASACSRSRSSTGRTRAGPRRR